MLMMAAAFNISAVMDNLDDQLSIQAIWKPLGRRLQQTDHTLCDIEIKHPQNDAECFREMIERWLEEPEADKDKLKYLVKICKLVIELYSHLANFLLELHYIVTDKPKLEELLSSVEDLEETDMQMLAKNLKLADRSSVHYNIKSTPQIRMKSMLQQWLDHSKTPTWAEFTHAMDKVGELMNITDVCENYHQIYINLVYIIILI